MKALSSILYSELATMTRHVTWPKLQRYGENITDQKLFLQHITEIKWYPQKLDSQIAERSESPDLKKFQKNFKTACN